MLKQLTKAILERALQAERLSIRALEGGKCASTRDQPAWVAHSQSIWRGDTHVLRGRVPGHSRTSATTRVRSKWLCRGHSLYTRPEHLYLKQVVDIAFGEKEDGSDSVPEADAEEVTIFMAARKHLPKSVFDPDKWKTAVNNDESLWRKVIYVLNRGGRYEEFAKGYKGNKVAHPYGRLINIFQEKTAKCINTMTGKHFIGLPSFIPPGRDYLGQDIKDTGYDLHLITFKTITMTKARTITNYWLLSILSEGYVLVNTVDAVKLGVKHGDKVKLLSASNPEGVLDVKGGRKIPIEGKAYVTEGIRPGVVAFPHGFGHWASGAGDVEVNGKPVKADSRRAVPLHGNSVMRVDPVTKNVGLSDLVGGSSVFYDTKVKLVKV